MEKVKSFQDKHKLKLLIPSTQHFHKIFKGILHPDDEVRQAKHESSGKN
jgi:hypothetical protein